MKKSKIVIVGGGPAGLSAALELVKNQQDVLLFEKDNQVGGLSKTIVFKRCRFDIGGHRFFTKSQEVWNFWREAMDNDFLKIKRLSRIFYKKKFFFYPLKPFNALFNLGFFTSIGVLLSYFKSKLFPKKPEDTFDRWVSNRFGEKLFNIFFKEYTEKVWGIPCEQIEARWAAQRIKGLSLVSAIKDAFFSQKDKIKTLIPEFHYPKYGPGMLYDKVAEKISKMGGKIFLTQEVQEIFHQENKIVKVKTKKGNNAVSEYECDFLISTLPINLLLEKLRPSAPETIREHAKALKFRSLLTVNVILKLKNPFPDQWVYVHSPQIKMVRIQNFNNWSPFMVEDKDLTALSFEYLCNQEDDFWVKDDKEIINIALEEFSKIKIAKDFLFLDGFVVRVPYAYPVYLKGYENHLKIVKDFLKKFSNLQTIGRAGMFRYNNMDHSILSGLFSARNILGENYDIWQINIEDEYLEEIKK